MWAANATPDIFLQYGIAGAVLIILLPFISKFVNGVVKAERERGDRLEKELREQNRIIQEKLVAELTRATQAIATILSRRRLDE